MTAFAHIIAGMFHRALLIVMLTAAACLAQSQPGSQPAAPPTTEPAKDQHHVLSDDKVSSTEHEITLSGGLLKYQADAGTLVLKDEAGKPRANMFFVSYAREQAKDFDPATRPITFIFNGGPGAAAVWLHLGAIGPRKLQLPDEATPIPAPPYRLVDNAQTWLDTTDLVFIDPVGTGFSRPAEGVKAEEFFGVQQDVFSVAEFIRLYTTRYRRWASPKFLAGESYGTTRAAAMSDYLLNRVGIQLNGILLISTVLDFQSLEVGGQNDLPYELYLPSYAAVAWYHKGLAPDLQKDLHATLAEVEQWTMTTYTAALARGDTLPADERAQIVQRLARYTGLPADLIERNNLRIHPNIFRKNLLADRKQIVGRFDGRAVGNDPSPGSDSPEYDPSFANFYAAYTATFNDYVRRTLNYESDLSYETLSDKVHPWSLDRGGHGYLDVADNLRSTLHQTPHLKVLFASGTFDLATPYFSTDYAISHLDLAKNLRANLTRTMYPAGHMIYHEKTSLEQLKRDADAFIRAASAGEAGSTTRPIQ